MSKVRRQRVVFFWHRHLSFRLAAAFLVLYILMALVVDWLPLAYGPNHLDLLHLSQAPFDLTQFTSGRPFHWLGTDGIGRDVLSNLLYGCRTSLLISGLVMCAATLVGMALGSLGGYLGDKTVKTPLSSLLILPVGGVFLWFHLIYSPYYQMQADRQAPHLYFLIFLLVALVIAAGTILLTRLIKKMKFFRKTVYLPIDTVVVKFMEITTAIPRLILLLCLVAFVYPSLVSLMLLATFSYWPAPARLLRAEIFKVKQLPYIQAAWALGLPPLTVFYKHVFLNALPPVFIAFTFGLTSLLALESTLSYLGIGVPPDLPSWGRLIAGIKSNMSAWWLAVLPGTMLALTVISIQTCSRFLQKAFFSAEGPG